MDEAKRWTHTADLQRLAQVVRCEWQQRWINLLWGSRWCDSAGWFQRFLSIAPSQVEFPEARIYEETLNTLLYETMPLPDNSLLEATRRRYNNCGSHSEEEEGPGGPELRERVRRIHVKRYSTYDDRQLGHWPPHRLQLFFWWRWT